LLLNPRTLRDIAGLIRAPIEETPIKLTQLLEDRKKLERELPEAEASSGHGRKR
jgi:hypothetical protein